MGIFDELIGVAVAGDHDDVAAGCRGAGRKRRDHVVRLDAVDLQRGNLQRFDHFVDQRDLRHEQVGGGLATRFVVAVEIVAERAAAGASNTTTISSGCSSVSTLTSIDVKPYTALVTVPLGVARSVGSA